MSDAVHRVAPKRLIKGLSGTIVALGVAGGALSMAMSGGPISGSAATHQAKAVAAGGPYFACVTIVSLDYGLCIGPPVNF